MNTPRKPRTDEELSSLRVDAAMHKGMEKTLEMLNEIKADLGVANSKLEAVEAQTTKTNGRVMHLELWRSKREGQIALAISLALEGSAIVGFTQRQFQRQMVLHA